MLPKLFLIAMFLYSAACGEVKVYESYNSEEISTSRLLEFEEKNNTFWCITEVEMPCDPNSFRRVDGTCNNMNYPTGGAGKTVHGHVLPTVWGEGFSSRLAKDGTPLPTPRHVRTQILQEGRVPHPKLTVLMANYMVLLAEDVVSLHDIVGMTFWHQGCCLPEGASDNSCYPNLIPEDDPVHRYSGHRCMNMTKPITFQSEGCLSNNTTPVKITTETPALDLSGMYGSFQQYLDARGRLFKDGLLIFEEDELGRVWPPNGGQFCPLNEADKNETRCNDGPNDIGANDLVGLNILRMWFWRQHNTNARELAKVNPSWSDEKLFYWAREINIAFFSQVLYYECLPALHGYENLVKSGVISTDKGPRELYDEEKYPQITMEFNAALRWIHTISEGTLFLYDSNGTVYDSIPTVDLNFRTGWFALERRLEGLSQGMFRQPGGSSDHVIDPHFGERVFSSLHEVLDVSSHDLARNRLFGLQPYVNYLQVCSNKTYTSFDDLQDFIDPERIEVLKSTYKYVEDIDLQAGIYAERMIEGGWVPYTYDCIVKKQLLEYLKSDRFWYERPGHPFNDAQLAEIRKYSAARYICNNADSVTEIQPNPFEIISKTNPLMSCDEYPTIDYSVWAESSETDCD